MMNKDGGALSKEPCMTCGKPEGHARHVMGYCEYTSVMQDDKELDKLLRFYGINKRPVLKTALLAWRDKAVVAEKERCLRAIKAARGSVALEYDLDTQARLDELGKLPVNRQGMIKSSDVSARMAELTKEEGAL